MTAVRLEGCRPTPLASYLKALGVLRLVGEQVDAEATGWWDDDRFVIDGSLDPDGLVTFFLDRYRPTPLVSPWNGGSGFAARDAKSSPAAVHAVEAIAATESERFAPYREAIEVCRRLVDADDWAQLSKVDMVQRCRAWLPDEALVWLDAAVVLTGDAVAFPFLLGTGGNVGRLEFSANFMMQLRTVLRLADGKARTSTETSAAWLRDALDGTATAPLVSAPIGQFDPGRAGGANSGPLGDAGALVNPWDFVLAFEGAVMFASGAARRLGSGAGPAAPAMPFMVAGTPAGYATATGENGKGEIWAPSWSRPATAAEIGRLIGEGRADWRNGTARSGLDLARAVATLGVDRGIDGFTRHAVLERYGQAMLAVPAGHLPVRDVARPEVALAAQLDRWADAIRRLKPKPTSVERLLRALDAHQLELATAGGPRRMQEVLITAAQLDAAVSLSGGLRRSIEPLGGRAGPFTLTDEDWWSALDDRSDELDLARALVSQGEPVAGPSSSARARAAAGSDAPDDDDRARAHRRLVDHLRPTRSDPRGRLSWAGSAPVTGLWTRPLSTVLADASLRRFVEATAADGDDGQVGIDPSYRYRRTARVEAVARFVRRELDESRLRDLVGALVLLGSFPPPADRTVSDQRLEVVPLPPLYRLLVPFWVGPGKPGREPTDALPPVRANASWPALLMAGRLDDVIVDACHRLRVARLTPLLSGRRLRRSASASDAETGSRTLAALCFPISRAAADAITKTVACDDVDRSLDPRRNPEQETA